MPITEAQHIAACEIAAQVYQKRLRAADGIRILSGTHGINENSAKDFIDDYRHLARGEQFQRAMSGAAMKHFMEQVALREGPTAEVNAVKALQAHIRYYEKDGKRTDVMRGVLGEFLETRPSNNQTASEATPNKAEVFKGDDPAYLRWTSAHPDGYVMNVKGGDGSTHYLMLHKAQCDDVTSRRGLQRGGFTERGYSKVCSHSLDALHDWATANRPQSLRHDCAHCLRGRHTVDYFTEEVGEPKGYVEGALKVVYVNAYERSARARADCIAHYGPRCSACNMDFGETYGEFATGFVHIHHLLPLSQIREGYLVDPIRDLRPVCPNCHAMLHYGGRNLSLEELKTILERRRRSKFLGRVK
jgi:hypothetical protein